MEKNNNEKEFVENARQFVDNMKELITNSKPVIITIENQSYLVTSFSRDKVAVKQIKDGNVFSDVSFEDLSTVIPDINSITITDDKNNEKTLFARLSENEEIFDVNKLFEEEELIITSIIDAESNSYGYCCYNKGIPYCYSQGTLINNLATPYDLEGCALRYPGPKSKIYRKMSGPFWYYVNEYDFEYLHFCIKSIEESDLKVTQRMTGFNEQDAVAILMVDFTKGKVNLAGDVQVIEEENKKNVRIGTIGLDFNFEKSLEMAVEAAIEGAGMLSFEEEENLREIYKQSIANSISIFGSVLKNVGIDYPESIEGGVPTIGFNEFWTSVKTSPSVPKVLEANAPQIYISNENMNGENPLIEDSEYNGPRRIG